MYCPLCGCEVSETARFCTNCGAALDAKSADSGDATNPFALGSQTRSVFDVVASSVPSNPWSAAKECFRKYFNGRGRASRTEFWFWIVFLYLSLCVLLSPFELILFFAVFFAEGGPTAGEFFRMAVLGNSGLGARLPLSDNQSVRSAPP